MRPADDQGREHDIRIVMEEKNALTTVAQALAPILDKIDDSALAGEHIDTTQADKLVLELSKHLGNIGGFCDKWTQNRIHAMEKLLSSCLSNPEAYLLLKDALSFMVGIQVDFNRRPFRAVGLSVEAWGTKFKALLKR
jgi:hypothetical protein